MNYSSFAVLYYLIQCWAHNKVSMQLETPIHTLAWSELFIDMSLSPSIRNGPYKVPEEYMLSKWMVVINVFSVISCIPLFFPTYKGNHIDQSFSNSNVHMNYLDILRKCRFCFSRSGVGISNWIPGDAQVVYRLHF